MRIILKEIVAGFAVSRARSFVLGDVDVVIAADDDADPKPQPCTSSQLIWWLVSSIFRIQLTFNFISKI